MRKQVLFILLSLCLLGLCGQASAQSDNAIFTMQSKSDQKTIAVRTAINRNTTLEVFDNIESIYGLAVTMDVEQLSNDYMVRVLLEDAEGRKYLVAESYKEIAPTDKKQQHFSSYCEETALLDGVKPVKLHVYITDANVQLNSISISNDNSMMKTHADYQRQTASLKEQQVQTKVDLINAYNEANNKLWRAGVTELSLKDHEEIMNILSCPEGTSTQGLEYYSGGIFELSPSDYGTYYGYIEPYELEYQYMYEFDWRNRHGRNWVTPVKNQGSTNACTAYACVGALESLTQLYYNQVDNSLDLAEGDVLNGFPDIHITGVDSTVKVVEYFATHGVNDQLYNNYIGEVLYPCDPRTLHVQPSGYGTCPSSWETIKQYLREKGPMVSGFYWGPYYQNGRNGHAMTLIGYGKVHEGMTLDYHTGSASFEHITIQSGNPKIGMDYFIFKNSYGEDNPNIPSYYYLAFQYIDDIIGPYYFTLPIQKTEYDPETGYVSKVYSESDIVCEDQDEDGFYFWGIGNRPSHCPQTALDSSDGDDSDSLYGPFMTNGRIMSLDPDNHELADTWDVFEANIYGIHCYSHSELEEYDECGTHGPVYFHNGATVTLKNGSVLNIENGNTVYNANIIMESGAKLRIRGNGHLKLAEGVSFNPPVGAIVEITEGSIEPFSN